MTQTEKTLGLYLINFCSAGERGRKREKERENEGEALIILFIDSN